MRVVLVRPDHHTHLVTPPLALGYLTAHLRRHGHQAVALDAVNLGLDNDALAARCTGAGLVGVSVLSDYYPQALDLVERLRRRGVRTVLGGPHATVLPHQVLHESGADFVVRGEGEDSLLELVRSLQDGGDGHGIPGVLARGRDELLPRPLLPDLDTLAFPDWESMPPRGYPMAPHGGVARSYPVAPVTSSRGCSFQCSFCSSALVWDRTVRFRSPANVVDEVEHLVRRYGVREVHFEDDNMTLRREHAAAICEGILSRGLDISWATPNGIRADLVDRELLTLMRASGLYSVAFGIESADPEVLRHCGKNTSVEVYEQAIAWARELGIITQGFFIFGLPGETPESMERTIRWACRSKLDKAQFLLLDVLPGTSLWHSLEHKPDLTRYRSFHDVTWCPPGIDPEALKTAPARAFRRFFLGSPRRVLRMLSLVRPRQLKYVLQRLSDFRVLPRLPR